MTYCVLGRLKVGWNAPLSFDLTLVPIESQLAACFGLVAQEIHYLMHSFLFLLFSLLLGLGTLQIFCLLMWQAIPATRLYIVYTLHVLRVLPALIAGITRYISVYYLLHCKCTWSVYGQSMVRP